MILYILEKADSYESTFFIISISLPLKQKQEHTNGTLIFCSNWN